MIVGFMPPPHQQEYPTLSTPPRAPFLNPDPIGLSTAYAESLTSYFTRMAFMNDLTPLQVIWGTNIAPVTRNHPDVVKLQSVGKGCFHRRAASTSAKGLEFVSILAAMLGRPELLRLHWGTSFTEFSFARMGRATDAWCTECLCSDRKPHGRMLWEIPLVTGCPEHGGQLQTACHACGAPTRFAGGDLLHCRKCGADRRDADKCAEAAPSQLAAAAEIGRIVALATDPSANFHGAAMQCIDALKAAAEHAGQGGFKDRATFWGTNAVTGWKWQRKKSVPALSRILEIALSGGFSLTELFDGQATKGTSAVVAPAKQHWGCRRLSPRERSDLINKLEKISREFPSWGPLKAATKLKVEQVTLYRLAPTLYATMTNNRRATLARLRKAKCAWFRRRVDAYVEKALAMGTRPYWTGLTKEFRKPGVLRESVFWKYAGEALQRANAGSL